VVSHGLGDRDLLARLGEDPEYVHRVVLLDLGELLALVLGLDLVICPNSQRHPGVGAPVTHGRPAVATPVLHRLEDPPGEPLRLARVGGSLGHDPRSVLVQAVLPVDDLGGHRDGCRSVEHRHFEGENRQVTLGEGHHPP